MDVSKPEVAAGVAESQLGVVEAELIEDGGVEVVDADFVFDGFEAEIVGGSVGDAAFDAAAGEEGGERGRVVVAAAAELLEAGVLDHRRAAEFACYDD